MLLKIVMGIIIVGGLILLVVSLKAFLEDPGGPRDGNPYDKG